MKLESYAKPIRIRIKLGDSEYSSLDSVKSHFSIKELYPLFKDGRLERWLMQIGESQLALRTSDLSKKCGDGDIKDYILFLSLFFNGISDSLSSFQSGKEWSLNDFLSTLSVDQIKFIYAKTKEIDDIDLFGYIKKVVSMENVFSIIEDPHLYHIYDTSEWGIVLSGLAKTEADFKKLFTFLERFSRNNPQPDKYKMIVSKFFSESVKNGYHWASLFKDELSLDFIASVYQNVCFKNLDIEWGALFADCVKDWDKDCVKIESIIGKDAQVRISFFSHCVENGIEEAKSKIDPWDALANSDDYVYIMEAIEKWDGDYRHYNVDDYNYSNIHMPLGKQILDFLQSLINFRGQDGSWGENVDYNSEYYLENEKRIMELVHERYYNYYNYTLTSNQEAKNELEAMVNKGVQLAKYVLENEDKSFIEIAWHVVKHQFATVLLLKRRS